MALTTNNTHTFQSGELVTSSKLNSTKFVQTGDKSSNDTFTGSEGQLSFDTENNVLRVHDGITAGGHKIQDSASAISIGNDSISTANLVDNAVTNSKLGNGAVITAKIASDAITTAKINNGAVTNAKVANGAITSAKINNGAVTVDKISDDQITSAKLADTGVVAGDYTSANIEVNSQGLVTSASNGDGGSSSLVYTHHIPTTTDGIHTEQGGQSFTKQTPPGSGTLAEIRAAASTIKTRTELKAPADAKFVHVQVYMDSTKARFNPAYGSPFHVQEKFEWAHHPDNYNGRVGILENHTGYMTCFVPFINNGSGEDYIQVVANPFGSISQPTYAIDGDNILQSKVIGYLS